MHDQITPQEAVQLRADGLLAFILNDPGVTVSAQAKDRLASEVRSTATFAFETGRAAPRVREPFTTRVSEFVGIVTTLFAVLAEMAFEAVGSIFRRRSARG